MKVRWNDGQSAVQCPACYVWAPRHFPSDKIHFNSPSPDKHDPTDCQPQSALILKGSVVRGSEFI